MCSISGVRKRWHEQGSHRLWKKWKMDEKIPCMEKSWNLKINEKSWNFGMRLLFGCQYHSNFFLLPSLTQQFKKIKCSFLNIAIQNRLLFIINKIFHVTSITYATYIFFAFYIALYDKRKVGCHTLNDHGNLMIDHGIIMEKSWNFILYFLWEPWIRFWDRLDKNYGCHGNQKLPLTYNGENGVSTFSQSFLIESLPNLKVSQMSSNSSRIGSFTSVLCALEHWKHFS